MLEGVGIYSDHEINLEFTLFEYLKENYPAKQKNFLKHENLFIRGQAIESIVFLTEGVISNVSYQNNFSSEASKVSLPTLPGGIHIPITDDSKNGLWKALKGEVVRYDDDVVALTDSVVYEYALEDLRDEFSDSEFNWLFMSELARALDMKNKLIYIKNLPVVDRVVEFLKLTEERNCGYIDKSSIANIIGTTRETVSRIMNRSGPYSKLEF